MEFKSHESVGTGSVSHELASHMLSLFHLMNLKKEKLTGHSGSTCLEEAKRPIQANCMMCLLPHSKSVEMKPYAQRVNDSLSIVGSVK